MHDVWTETAAWVEAIGTIAAVVGATWIAAGESRATRRREELSRSDSIEREQRGLNAARTAVVNLAILATTQIHELHVLLKDEARRMRVANVSPSRTVVTNEHPLTAFPIQSLNDAEAMVAFAYFPGALATAAEIYANLEAAVRTTDESERKKVFAGYAHQMELLDSTAQRRLTSCAKR